MTVAYAYQQLVAAVMHDDDRMLAYLWRDLEEECRRGAAKDGIPLDPGPVEREEIPLWWWGGTDPKTGEPTGDFVGEQQAGFFLGNFDRETPNAYMLIVRAHFPKEPPVDRPLAPVPHEATPAPADPGCGCMHYQGQQIVTCSGYPHRRVCAVCTQPVRRDEAGAWEHVAAGSTAGGDPLAVTPT